MKRISLTQHLIEEQRQHNTIPAELRLLIEVVSRACKTISHAVGKGALPIYARRAMGAAVPARARKRRNP